MFDIMSLCRSYIKPYPQAPASESVSVDTPAILNCTKAVDFWISWSGTTIRVGRGTQVGSGVFMSWADNNRQIYAASLSSGWGTTADWYFESPSGE